MNAWKKNIVMITAGGVGQRMGGDMPKQYLLLDGKPVIEYVIEACRASRYADAILVVAAPKYHQMLRETYGVEVCNSGDTLNQTKRRGFDEIRRRGGCEKLVVADAVRPFVTTEVIDRLFSSLETHDAAACARTITDSLGSYKQRVLQRDDFYTLNAPESFRFDLLDQHFRADSPLSESIHQLPEDARVELLFDVPYFDKITFPEDFEWAEALLTYRKNRNRKG